MDCRFGQSNTMKYMPKWIRAKLKVSSDAKTTVGELRGFFNKMAAYQRQGRLTTPSPIVQISNSLSGQGGTGSGSSQKPVKVRQVVRPFRQQSMADMEGMRKSTIASRAPPTPSQPKKRTIAELDGFDELDDIIEHHSQRAKIGDEFCLDNTLTDNSQSQSKRPRKKIRMKRDNSADDILKQAAGPLGGKKVKRRPGRIVDQLFDNWTPLDVMHLMGTVEERIIDNPKCKVKWELKTYAKTYISFCKDAFSKNALRNFRKTFAREATNLIGLGPVGDSFEVIQKTLLESRMSEDLSRIITAGMFEALKLRQTRADEYRVLIGGKYGGDRYHSDIVNQLDDYAQLIYQTQTQLDLESKKDQTI